MKRIYLYIVTIVSLMTGFTSCSDSFLEINHTDIVTPEVFFLSQENVERGLNGIYDLLLRSNGSDLENNWNLKPQIAFSNYPARDMQPDGWDQEFGQYTWKPDFYMFEPAWLRGYMAIDRVNLFLDNLEKIDPILFKNGNETKNQLIAESRAIRAWFYTYLVQSWGGVPMLMTGETYANTPGKTRNSTEDAWALIIEDYEYARDVLDWKPRNGEYGRVTKGMAKAYLGLAYMYQKRWADAKKELKDVLDCGLYELTRCYGYIHLESKKWQKESVWEIAFNDWSGSYNMPNSVINTYPDAAWLGPQMCASSEYGGWGPWYTSYEFVWSHEPGDKRLSYNVAQFGEFNIGYPSLTLGEPGSAQIGVSNAFAQPFVSSFILPNNYCMKHWRKHPQYQYHAFPVTYMRLAGVMLNYAETCFETGDMAEGWKYIKTVRDRAWGKLEAGSPVEGAGRINITLNDDPNVEAPDAETYYNTYKRTAGRNHGMVNKFMGWMPNGAGTADSMIATGTTQVNKRVGYYEKRHYEATTTYQPYSSPVWKVALVMERRHEFYGEYSFWQDLCRMGIAEEYLNAEYPVNKQEHITVDLSGTHDEQVQKLINTDFAGRIETWQPYPFNPARMLFPIPQAEMDANPAFTKEDQNPGY